MIGLLLAVAMEADAARMEAARKAIEALNEEAAASGATGATMEFYWAPAPAAATEAPAVSMETPVVEPAPVAEPAPAPALVAESAPAIGFHSEVEVFRVAASARGRGEAQRLLDATVAKLVAKGVDRSRIETDVSIGPRKVRIQIVKVKNVVRNPEGSSR